MGVRQAQKPCRSFRRTGHAGGRANRAPPREPHRDVRDERPWMSKVAMFNASAWKSKATTSQRCGALRTERFRGSVFRGWRAPASGFLPGETPGALGGGEGSWTCCSLQYGWESSLLEVSF